MVGHPCLEATSRDAHQGGSESEECNLQIPNPSVASAAQLAHGTQDVSAASCEPGLSSRLCLELIDIWRLDRSAPFAGQTASIHCRFGCSPAFSNSNRCLQVMQGPGWGQAWEQQNWAEWQAWQSQQQQPAHAWEHYDSALQWHYSGGGAAPSLPSGQQGEPCPLPAKRQRLEQLDQRMIFLQSAGGMPHRQNGAARAVAARALPLPGRRPAQRAANAAAAASVAALPSSATGEYLDAYPAVKRLLQRFK